MHLSVRSLPSRVALLCGVSAVAMLMYAPPTHAQSQAAKKKPADEVIELTVDVAEDLSGKFVPTFVRPEHTQPERGSFYLTEGRVFPAGTIEGDGSTFDPNRSGHIGVWISRGTHIVAASDIPDAGWWATTAQLFVLGRQGLDLITSEGLEGNGTRTRMVTGGAGIFAGRVGEQRTTFLGTNPTGGANLRVTFVLRKVGR